MKKLMFKENAGEGVLIVLLYKDRIVAKYNRNPADKKNRAVTETYKFGGKHE